MASFENKVIAITGGASGIGRAVAFECARRGASLALADLQEKALDSVAAELRSSSGTKVTTTIVDVSISDSVDAWIKTTMNHYGRLDGAANIAGIGGNEGKIFNSLTETENSTWDKIIGVNLTGVFYCMRAQLRVMKEGAAIVNAASIAGLRHRVTAYSVSKHGVVGLTRSAAKDYGKRGIRVNAVAPGPTQTPLMDKVFSERGGDQDKAVFNSHKNLAIPRLGTPEEIAKTFVFLLSDDSSWTTGSTYTVDGGAIC